MTRRVLWLALFVVLVVVGARMVEYSESAKVEVLRVVGIGLLAMSLARGRELRARLRSPLDVAVMAWLGIECLSTLCSSAPLLSIFGEQEQHEGLLTSLAFAGVYAAARLDAQDPADGRRNFDVWFAGTALASVWAFLQATGVVLIAADHAQLAGVMRPFGTLGHPNLLGVVTAAAAVAAFARARTESSRRVLHLAAFVVFAAATAITFSRGAWLALGAGLLTAILLGLRSPAARPLPRGAWIAIALVALGLAGVAAFSGWGGAFAARLQDFVSPTSGSSRSRLEIWRAALAAWRARPLLGWGPDTFGLASERFQTPGYWQSAWGEVTVHAHSIVLQTLATRGALGLLAAFAMAGTLAMALRDCLRRGGEAAAQAVASASACVALVVAGLFGAWGIAGALIATLLAAHVANAAGAGAAAVETSARTPSQRHRHARGATVTAIATARAVPRIAAIAGVSAAMGMAVFVVNELLGSRAIATSMLELREAASAPAAQAQGIWPAVSEDAGRATRRLPWDDHGPRVRASALMQWASGSPDPGPLLNDAEQQARTAVRRVPQRAANHQCLADALLQRSRNGDPVRVAAWDSSYASAARLWPSNPYVLAGWARSRNANGLAGAAREQVATLERLYPGAGLAALVGAEVALAQGDTLSARAALDRAANGDWYGDIASLTRAERLSRALAARR